MQTLREIGQVRRQVGIWRADHCRVGVVMTMGALHDGHLSLVMLARQECDRVLVTVFVNPLQFGVGEDFDKYPRDEANDIRLLGDAGCDTVFVPSVTTMFPRGDRDVSHARTVVSVRGITNVLCGPHRPGYFEGVTTEVLRMLNIVGGDAAYFGEKDYQQYVVVAAMVEDLGLPVQVVVGPTIREPDGLALSSRNAYLTVSQRAAAPELYRALHTAALEIGERGVTVIPAAAAAARRRLLAAGFEMVEYLEARDASLKDVGLETAVDELRVFGAARLGQTRLIDNVRVTRPVCP